ncbi:SIMPL domain-containing protein [Sphingomonas elodea]|uniref:SIMPL domain-containing protein n=1 Tax=Sphingomonas elodea TaxID=179878 RepID=UPI00026302B0|nr:SIMPL domain-containing protein [Sphingomonas elodea]
MLGRGFVLALALGSEAVAIVRTDLSVRAASLEGGSTASGLVKPDRVVMTLRYLGEGKTRADAEGALKIKLEKLLAVLKAEGIAPTAIRDLTPQEADKIFSNVVETVEVEDVESSEAEASKPNFTLSEIKKLILPNADQANAVKAKLLALDVKIDDIAIEPDMAAAERP